MQFNCQQTPRRACVSIKTAFEENPSEVFNWLIGKDIPNIDRDMMHKVWVISGGEIVNIYRRICRERSGVG